MKKFLFLYKGGSRPESEEEGQVVMERWMNWFKEHEADTVDAGNPTINGQNVQGEPTSGYGIFKAESMEDALKLVDGHPMIADGGWVEVYEIEPVEM